MKLGDVLKKEREKKGLSVEDTANGLDLSAKDYEALEGGESDAEKWGPLLAEIAILLETPTSRLLAESGRAEDTADGQAGKLITQHRERREKTVEQMAEGLSITKEEYESIEAGKSPIEKQGPLLLRFAEVIEQPVFNLFYPCGLPFTELDDYP
ncbi:MAG: helix-turn-helix domain-containing protein [Deltaproteobacteria bacterium]|nr:helix-turn-helix domain-containing protein [Deltaproteobacteria bacterium]